MHKEAKHADYGGTPLGQKTKTIGFLDRIPVSLCHFLWLRSVGYTAQDFLKLSVTINWSAYSHETCVRARNPYVSFTDIPKLCKILLCRCLEGFGSRSNQNLI